MIAIAFARLRCLIRAAERGTTSLELALLTPVFLLLVLGTVDLGQAVVLYNVSGQAAREGARHGLVAVQPNPTVTAPPTMTAPQATAIAVAARDGAGPLAGSLAVTSSAGLDARGPFVQVVVSATYQPVAGQFLGISSVPVGGASKVYLP